MRTWMLFIFFFKQKTGYEMRISDWSSDVCSSDLHGTEVGMLATVDEGGAAAGELGVGEGFDNVDGRFEGNGLGVHVLFSSCVNENKLSESHDVSQRKQSTLRRLVLVQS